MGSESASTQQQSTTSIDRRLTAGGDLIGLQDSTITTNGGSVYVTSANAELAKSALATAESIGMAANETARKLAAGSNAIAAEVAASQAQFVAVASGQSAVIKLLVGMGLVFGGVYVFTRKKA